LGTIPLKKLFSEIMLTLLLVNILTLAFSTRLAAVPDIESKPDSSNSIVLRFDFDAPSVAVDSLGDSITMQTLPQFGAPGEPVLPFRLVKMLIPQGKEVKSLDVTSGDRKALEGSYNLRCGKTPIPISSNLTVDDKPKESVYSSTVPFPNSLYSDLSEQYMRAYKILLFKVHPVQYIPKTGELYYFETMTVTATLQETGDFSPFFRNLLQDATLISQSVDNGETAKTYAERLTPLRQAALIGGSTHYDYVLITNESLSSAFQPLIDWKKLKGLNATIVLVEDIMKNPDYNSNGLFGDGQGSLRFNDTQAHIRNFIKDAYLNWGTEYVLLGGDDDIIPARGVYDCAADSIGDFTDYNIPCDLYYGALDGSWDKDNDTIFGEAVYHWSGPENATTGEEADFFAEVYIGRATVDTPQEATNFVNKTISYEQSSQQDYLKKMLAIGTKLDDITEGGNGEDAITDIVPQYTTTRLYARDGTFSRIAVLNALNNGTHIVSHDGHSNFLSVMGLSISDVDSLTNSQYFFAYSVGCYSAAFDQATSGSTEAIAEHFLFNPHGAFAYIGNSRYGWYCSDSVDGPGERYARSFFSQLNNDTRNLGKALQISKQQEPILDRWTYFTLNLLGDPETEIVTAIKAPTAHFETRTDLLTPPRIYGDIDLCGTAKRGTASGSTFSNYTVDFGVGTAPTSWTTTGISLLNNGANEIINGTLATWNSSSVASNTYTLRLTVSDGSGLVGETRQVVVVSINSLPVYIRTDGSVDPPSAPVTRSGDIYALNGNIYSDSEGIVVERNNIILEGAGYTIQGSGGGGAGIYLFERSNVTIKNLIVTAHLYGVYLKRCSDNTILGSIMTNNIHGILLSASSYNNISNTNVTNNYDGVSLLSFSKNNTITGCRITGNNGAIGNGIYFYLSSNNLIYHNIFSGNTIHVYDAAWDCADPGLILPSINQWDIGYPSGGNYWNNYTGADLYKGLYQNVTGSDGIGDTPYTLDRNNRDRYPRINSYMPAHDLASTDIMPLKTVVGQGYNVNISITVTNYGLFDENLNLSVSANSHFIARVTTMFKAGNAVTLNFVWNVSGLDYGNYTIEAAAEPVLGETNTANNNCTCDKPVHVGVPGDISGPTQGVYDGKCDMRDINYLIGKFNGKPGDPKWAPNADVNNDNVINMRDIQIAILNFNKHE
jgi:parallel beta-helix repeat protein